MPAGEISEFEGYKQKPNALLYADPLAPPEYIYDYRPIAALQMRAVPPAAH